jgi:beta-lactamase regulating signal transducer with metallopeptidase domain
MNAWELLPIPFEAQAYALQVAIGGVCVCALALAVARMMRRRAEPLRYGILLAGVLGLLAVPALVGLGRTCQDLLPWPAAEANDEVMRLPVEMLPELLNRPAMEPAEPATEPPAPVGEFIGAALLALWGLGTLIGMVRLVFALAKQGRALVGESWRAGFWTHELQAQLARKLGLRRFPAVHISPVVPMPMVIGIWRPAIVLPEPAPSSWQQPQWEAVLLHEAAHIARGDPWAVVAQRVAVLLFWWCPLVHLLARRLNELRESICDDCALQGACDRLAYAELLVESAEHFLSLQTGAHAPAWEPAALTRERGSQTPAVPLGLLDSARGGLEARVKRLLEKEKPTMTKLSLSGKLLGAALLVGACLLTAAGTAFSGGQPQPHKKIQIKILVDGKEIDLSDAELWSHVEASQKKAANEKQQKQLQAYYYKALGVAQLQPDGGTLAAGKKLALSPDGKVLVTADGARVVVLDPGTGRIIAQVDQSKDDKHVIKYRLIDQPASGKPDETTRAYRLIAELVQDKADPRIEDLVKRAEAIKPGSGAEIRRALQGLPKPGDAPKAKDPRAAKPAPTHSLRLWDPQTGKQLIILQIDDGKVLQLHEADLRKLLEKVRTQAEVDSAKQKADLRKLFEKHIRIDAELDLAKQKADEKARLLDMEKLKADEIARILGWIKKANTDKVGDKKPAPGHTPDLEALSRQIERLSIELRDLRKRLDEGKK